METKEKIDGLLEAIEEIDDIIYDTDCLDPNFDKLKRDLSKIVDIANNAIKKYGIRDERQF